MFRQNRTRIYNTILGYYQYDDTFFDTLIVPEFLNREILINEIIVQAGLLETAYSDGDLLKKLIGMWSVARAEDWTRMYNALYSEYVPIHNYDKHSTIDNTGHSSVESGNIETGTSGKQSHTDDINVRTDNLTEKTDNINDTEYNNRDTRTDNLTNTRTDNLTNTRTDNLTNTRTDNLSESHGGGETTTHENTAYNVGLTATSRDILQRNGDVVNNTGTQQNTNTGTQQNTNTGTQQNSNTGTQINAKTGTDTETLDGTKRNTGTQTDDRDVDYTETSTDSRTQTGNSLKNDRNNMTEYTFGNIGVTTTQKMITEEIELRVKYNIYELIATEFKEKFCNLIYAL